MIPQPTSCGTLSRPFMGGSSPLGSRSRREPETSSTAKTPRRKQNRNTASSKSLFLSASKINTSQPRQSIGPSLPSAPPAEGATTCQPGLLAPRVSLCCTFPSTAAKPHLVRLLLLLLLLLAADGAGTTTTNGQDLPTTNPPALRPRGILVGGLKQKREEQSQLVEMRLCKHITS